MPTIQLSKFDGGVINATDASLIPLEASTVLSNSDVSTGVLIPRTQKTEIDDPDIPELTNQDGNRSIVRFGGEYYFSDNETSELSSTLGFIGITPPTSALGVLLGPPGDRFTGNLKYLFIYATADGHRSAPFLPGQPFSFVVEVDTLLEVARTVSEFEAPDWKEYLKDNFKGKLLPTIDVSKPRDDRVVPPGPQTINIGLLVSWEDAFWRLKVSIDLLNVSRTLGTTSINRIAESEWQPGGSKGIWENITLAAELSFKGREYITVGPFPSPTEAAVDRVLVFRTLQNQDTYFLNRVVILDQETTYEDRLTDAELASREQLEVVNAFPPIQINTGRVGGKVPYGG